MKQLVTKKFSAETPSLSLLIFRSSPRLFSNTMTMQLSVNRQIWFVEALVKRNLFLNSCRFSPQERSNFLVQLKIQFSWQPWVEFRTTLDVSRCARWVCLSCIVDNSIFICQLSLLAQIGTFDFDIRILIEIPWTYIRKTYKNDIH